MRQTLDGAGLLGAPRDDSDVAADTVKLFTHMPAHKTSAAQNQYAFC
jgi:hypothetical protein